MDDVVILAACRTPVGAFGGAYRDVSAVQLGTTVARAALSRAGVPPDQVDEVVFGCAGQPYNAMNVARVIAVEAGLPRETPAYSVQRNCASGIQAITSAAQAIRAGDAAIVLAGGVENLSQAPYILDGARWGYRLRPHTIYDAVWSALTDPLSGLIMGETAENLAQRYGISREEQDAFALESHNKAFRAARSGRFNDEIVPVTVPKKRGEPEVVTVDETPQAGLSLAKLALYPPVFREGGSVTAGNACPLNDAAAAVVLASARRARDLGVRPLARIVAYAYVGVEPEVMGIGPACSTPIALRRAGLTLDDLDLIEINEAFAAQVLAVERELGWRRERVNVNGGGIALGHPIGATGVRLTVTLLHELQKRGGRYGLATLCVGGGQGASLIIERLDGSA